MQAILDDVGIAGAMLAYELADGTIQLIDGHLRTDLLKNETVPVLILDVTEDEASKILLTYDPIGAMAEADRQSLAALMNDVQTSNQDLADMITMLAEENGLITGYEEKNCENQTIKEIYNIIIEFSNEKEQAIWLEKLESEGLSCKSIII